jgi:acetyl esterase/lipase
MSGPSTSDVAGGSQEDAAAAWRAQRAQKSCLHSDKPGDSKDAAAKWHPMEAIWRVGTLPLKIAHNSIAVSFRERTRQSWSASLEQAVRNLRTYSQNSTLSLAMVRRSCCCSGLLHFCPRYLSLWLTPAFCLGSIHDNVVGSSSVPVDVTRTQCDLGSGLKAWWFMPDTLRHQAEASRFIFYVHGPTSSPGSSSHRALVSRLALEAGAAVLMVDYRRTPEKTREESQDDVSKAYRWLVVQPGVTPASTLVMADGLGCALALNLCADLRDETAAGSDDVQPAGIGLLSPWVDLSDSGTFKSKSWEKNQQVDYLSQRILSFTASGYAGLSPVRIPLLLSSSPPLLLSSSPPLLLSSPMHTRTVH